jgi:hypothetical protein
MTYEQLKTLKPEDFKRACGVAPPTFEEMRHALQAYERKKIKPGRPPKLSLENRLLMALQYCRGASMSQLSVVRSIRLSSNC